MGIKSLSIRIDEDLLDKIHVVADYEGRSANSEINILIRDAVEQFEAKHGEIVLHGNCVTRKEKRIKNPRTAIAVRGFFMAGHESIPI